MLRSATLRARSRRWFAPAPSAPSLLALMTLMTMSLSGCQIAGLVASAVPKFESASYDGLAGQNVGVMVDVDDAVLIDWPELRLDVASGVQDKLQQAQKGESKELAKTQFPYPPASIVRFQREHPDLHAQPITAIAPRLGTINRLLYVEMEDFQTHPSGSVDLFRGTTSVRLKVIEVKDGRARVAYEDVVRTQFP